MARNEWIPMPAMTTRHPWTPASSWLIKNSKNRESNSSDSSSPAHQQKIITFGSPINLRRMRSNCNCTSESHTYMPVCVQSVSCKIYAIDLVKSNPAYRQTPAMPLGSFAQALNVESESIEWTRIGSIRHSVENFIFQYIFAQSLTHPTCAFQFLL